MVRHLCPKRAIGVDPEREIRVCLRGAVGRVEDVSDRKQMSRISTPARKIGYTSRPLRILDRKRLEVVTRNPDRRETGGPE